MTRLPRSKRKNSTQDLKKVDVENLKGRTKEIERKSLTPVFELVKDSGALNLKTSCSIELHHIRVPFIFNTNGIVRRALTSKLQQKAYNGSHSGALSIHVYY